MRPLHRLRQSGSGFLKENRKLKRRIQRLEGDAAALRKAQQALKKSEETYRTVFANTGTATMLIEKDATIAMVNAEFEKLSGFSRHEVEGRQVWTVFVENEADRERMKHYHHLRRINPEAAPRTYECRLRNKKGDPLIATMTVAMIPGTQQSIASVLDITQRRKTEEALKISEEKFAKAFHSSPVAMMIATMDEGLILDVNNTLLKMTGYPESSIVSAKIRDMAFWPDTDLFKSLARELMNHGRFHQREMTYRTHGGEIRHGNLSADIVDFNGKACMLTAILDITEQRRLEKEILRTGEEERRKIGYDLHDDLGQHLVGVEAMASLLHKRLLGAESPGANLAGEITELIRSATTKTRNIAKGLCPVNLDAGGLAAALSQLAEHIENVFQVHCRFEADTETMKMDHNTAVNLYRIAQEAVSNALRHGRADQIHLGLHNRKQGISLFIKDNGQGLPHSLPDQGMGLGIMTHRARRIGADIDIRNRSPHSGAEVLCRIPHVF
ncbi:PAS domain S-box-containing protein [Desulfobotulus alkaliphilus]|uniref:histidine kinase n=1 Tax=Desulfobotulus alkaliphilus TaxID=622671 RepID=A0A562S7P1_9BACT|nr:PAS domain S-box protein [Desulfobotulus alkaliphilus]TWI77451.1 PAS domain S-box-containing protein [Desulfobotulus alkaliphilus]